MLSIIKKICKLFSQVWGRLIVDLVFCFALIFLFTTPLTQSTHEFAEADDISGVNYDSIPIYPYTQTFKITAYYSPLPCQKSYVTGSYDGDIRLNGSGVNSADGTPVYPGMVAAPKSYEFGTKMEIPGVGSVAVHDRGGAIKSGGANSHDRLDIWMGYGDAGLRRALQWGKRTVDVVVWGLNPDIKEEITLSNYSPNEAVPDCSGISLASANVPEEPEVDPYFEPAVVDNNPPSVFNPESSGFLSFDLKSGDSGESVLHLQAELSNLNLLRADLNGEYDELTAHAVFKFQQAQFLVGDKNSPGAGVFGPKTRQRLNEIVASRNYTDDMIAQKQSELEDQEMKILLASDESVAFGDGFSDKTKKIGSFSLTTEMDFGLVNEEVQILQEFLKINGYFDGSFTSDYFGPMTREAVLAFQIDKGIVASGSDLGAGRVGPATLEVINDLI